MPLQPIGSLRHPLLATAVARGQTSLWILPNASQEQVSELACVPWTNVWNLDESIDFASVLQQQGSDRRPIIVGSPDQDVTEFSSKQFVRIYRSHGTQTQNSTQLQEFRKMQLKSLVGSCTGLLFFAGPIPEGKQSDIGLIHEFAPHLVLVALNAIPQDETNLPPIFLWTSDVKSLCHELIEHDETSTIPRVALSGTPALVLDGNLLRAIEGGWTFLTTDRLRGQVTQDGFEQFLEGEPEWPIFAAGAAYPRRFNATLDHERVTAEQQGGALAEHVLAIIRELERTEPDPRDAVRQLRIFSEPGSGTTTTLREAAVTIALQGYPTLISKSSAVRIDPVSVKAFVIDLLEGPGRYNGGTPAFYPPK